MLWLYESINNSPKYFPQYKLLKLLRRPFYSINYIIVGYQRHKFKLMLPQRQVDTTVISILSRCVGFWQLNGSEIVLSIENRMQWQFSAPRVISVSIKTIWFLYDIIGLMFHYIPKIGDGYKFMDIDYRHSSKTKRTYLCLFYDILVFSRMQSLTLL